MITIILSAMLGLFTLLHELPAVERAQFVVPPEVFIRHTPERSFIGPGMFALESGDILMAAPWGRPPVHFEEVVAKFPVPMLYRSKDGGRTWREQGRMQMEWKLPGLISDGGTSFLRLRDGRLAVVFNRHVKGLHGGGAPVIALSGDDGDSWTAANALIENDDAFYVMNDRLIQLSSGRLLLPVARKVGKTEGDRDEGLAMLSDDGGATWRLSRGTAGVDAPRGMAEPCVSELSDGRVLMLGRTGLGSIHAALSSDSGETWSTPEATTLESACSSLTLKTLPDGRLIVFYNHATPIKAGAFFPRTPLCYAVSEDGGKTWSAPVIVDDEGAADKGRQNIYPSVCFTAEGMVVMWSTHGADPKGSFKGQYDPNIGGGKRAVLAMPAKAGSSAATAVGLSIALPDAPQASDTLPSVSTRHVIVSHSKEKGRNGEASLIDLRDGSMLLMYGAHEKSGDWDRGEIRQIRSQDGGQTWSAPETVFHDAQRSLFQVAFARLANHDLGLTYTSLANGRDAFKVFRRSTDEGRTWSDPVKISDDSHEYTTGPWDKLYVLASGRVLALLHCNMKPDARKQGGPLGVYTVFSDDHGKTWTRSPVGEVLHVSENPYNKHEWGFWEPSLVETAPGRLLMLGRTTTGWLWETRSEDSGRTWSAPAQTSISNPVAPPVLTRIPNSDTLVLIQNPDVKISENWHGGERVALAFRTSRDGGNTWSPPTDIYRSPNADLWMDYPAVRWIQGQLHLVWRHTDRRAAPRGGMGDSSLYHQVLPRGLMEGIYPLKEPVASQFSRTGLREAETLETDICIYGGTPGGVMAAVQAARMGRKVVIVEPGRHLGGMTSGGLSAVDIGDPRTVGGLAREYFSRLVAGYGKKLDWDRPHTAQGGSGHGTGGAYAIEPHRAERVFEEMAEEAGVRVLFEARLASVKKDGTRILELVMENGAVVRGRMFLDTTYEGDLMAKADVGYTLTREGNQKYGESYNGIHYTDVYKPRTTHLVPEANGRVKGGQGVWDRDFPIDPYVVKRDPKSGLLPLINEGEPGTQGDPAPGVQAFCFRLCLSTAADRLPIAPPPDYDAKQYEIVVRFIDACLAHGDDMDLRWFSKHDQVPNQKWDFNTATFGGNLPGASHEWPEATYTRRVEIAKQHENYHRGLLHFLATDARVPQKVRDDISRFGLPRDEFTENGGWPHQLYIREARRMLSDLVLTEHHTHGRQVAPHSIGLGSYGTDTHEVRRIVKDGVVTREGKTAGGRGGFGPYQIGYGAIVPKAGECENLFVTFALSASHTAFSSIRMEPVFMVTSQSAATAACLALEDAVSVQQVNQEKLRARLLADGQVLEAAQQAAVRQPEISASPASMPLRILLLGDSITRGSYLAQKDGKATGLPHPMSGGWRKALQDKLRAAGIPYDFVGELNYASFGKDGTVDPQFDPDHHGLAGFGNTGILNGGTVPTPADVLASLGVNEIKVPGIVEVLKKHQPDVILLMSGANGFDAPARDTLIRTIGKESNAHLFVANILPQKAPRAGWEQVDAYNASLPSTVAAQKAVGKHITFVNMYAAVTPDDLLPDGVHPNQAGMEKMAATWFAALSAGLAKER